MKSKPTATSISLLAAFATTAVAHAETPPKMKMTTETPEEITTPDKVETAIGNLEFFDGVPSQQTVQTLYNNLDRMRGVQTFLAGQDKGKGGKYLVLPPGYKGDVPDGYFVLEAPTYRNWVFLRGSIANGVEPAVENIEKNSRSTRWPRPAIRLRPSLSTHQARWQISFPPMISPSLSS